MRVKLHAQCIEARDCKLPLQFSGSRSFRLKALPDSQSLQRSDENQANQNVDGKKSA
jgi:hypothetical protein